MLYRMAMLLMTLGDP